MLVDHWPHIWFRSLSIGYKCTLWLSYTTVRNRWIQIKHFIVKTIATLERVQKYTHLPWLKFVFDTVLKAFAFDLHRSQHQTVSDEVRRVSNTFTRFKTEIFNCQCIIKKFTSKSIGTLSKELYCFVCVVIFVFHILKCNSFRSVNWPV